MKKRSILVILLLLMLASIGFYLVWYKGAQNIDILETTFKFEYGEVVKLDGKNILNTEDSTILKSFSAEYEQLKLEDEKDYPKIGTYELQINYSVNGNKQSDTVKIIIEDTRKPEFTKYSDKIEVKKGSDLNELVSYFEVDDLSPCEITINTEKLDINQVGEYDVDIIATDKYMNKSVRNAKVVVIEDVVAVPDNNEVANTTPTAHTVAEPRYVNGIMIVNKKNPVPYNYAPYENGEAGNQVRSLINEMQNLGYNIHSSYSGFRSFDIQAGLYQNYVNNYGQQEADTFSARPGYSEHQTGLAFDLLHQNGALVENTAEVNWISQNAHRYGFIVRYLPGKEHITGYQAEPWHIRYIGPLATDIYNSGLTLEEYLGIQGGSY